MITVTVAIKGQVVSNHTFAGKDPVRIGRAPDNDVFLDNPALSRHHAVIASEDRTFTVRDLQSDNGVFVNGKRITTHRLNPGDVIGIGKFTIVVSIQGRGGAGRAPDKPGLTFGLGGTRQVTLASQPSKRAATPIRHAGHLVTPAGPLELKETALFVGGASDCHLAIRGLLVPPRVALLIGGDGGFSLLNLIRPEGVLLGGLPLPRRAWLRDGDVLRFVDRLEVTFKEGLPAPPGA